MGFRCPECSARLDVRNVDGQTVFSCSCGLVGAVPYGDNEDESYLELLDMHERGELSRPAFCVRDPAEIEEMIRLHRPDDLVKSILTTKRDYIAHYESMAGGAPEYGESDAEPGLSPYLERAGISRLFAFQQDAIRRILAGENVVIEAPTASGKTVAFTVPILMRIAGCAGLSALFVYPTKALARDQLPKIRRMADAAGIRVDVLDGDTPPPDRKKLLDRMPHIIITNFDSLHHHMLRRTAFSGELRSVRFVVVDEVHTYSGVFGTNIHYVIKRLERLCGPLQVVCASATLENAAGFCGALFGKRVSSVRDLTKTGRTDLVMISSMARTRPALMLDIARRLVQKNHKTMVFHNSHVAAEMFAIRASPHMSIRVHRAGLSAKYREGVESEFRSGATDALSCTSTMELGIDIGDIDGVISPPVPINRLIQRIGRAARHGQRGYAFLALGNDPMSQHYARHPRDYFEDVERLYIDPSNPFVREFQVFAMACDRPISDMESEEYGDAIQSNLEKNKLVHRDGYYHPNKPVINAVISGYSIRGMGEEIGIFFGPKKLGSRSLPMALAELHKDAVYLLGGSKYLVTGLHYPEHARAELERFYGSHYTRANISMQPRILEVLERRAAYGIVLLMCRLKIVKTVSSYNRFGDVPGDADTVQLEGDLVYEFETKGVAFRSPRPAKAEHLAEPDICGHGYHAAEHVMIEGSNMITGGAARDLGGISMAESGMIYIYDGAVGGSGACRAIYDRFEKVAARGRAILDECPCSNPSGCPRCTYSYQCGNNNSFLHKEAGLEILDRIISGEETEPVDEVSGASFV